MKRSLIFSTIALSVIAFAACSERNAKKNVANEKNSRIRNVVYFNVKHGNDGVDGGDLRLSIKDTTQTDSTINYEVVSLNGDKEIGLLLSIPKKARPTGFGNGFVLKSIGEPSNLLLGVLSALYRHELAKPQFVDEIKVSYVDLRQLAKTYEKDGNAVGKIGADYKLFFEGDDGDEEPAELFINVDSAANYIEIKEKDPDYRAALIKALSKKEAR
jgi:hypothetical protein